MLFKKTWHKDESDGQNAANVSGQAADAETVQPSEEKLERMLAEFGRIESIDRGAMVTRYAVELNDGVIIRQITDIKKNIAKALGVKSVSFEIPISGTSLIGIVCPNTTCTTVRFSDVASTPKFCENRNETAVALGKNLKNEPVICMLERMPHLLIAGGAGCGKSMCVHSMLMSMLSRVSPQELRLLLVDPTQTELDVYNGIPHLLTDVISEPAEAIRALEWLNDEIVERYKLFRQASVRNIEQYNKAVSEDARMPRIVAIVEEYGALMRCSSKRTEENIMRLSALARAVGVCLVITTQRISLEVITGIIKANIPSRIAFAVTNNIDSRMIIDCAGAEELLGKGDMLYYPRDEFHPIRVQGSFVSMEEISELTEKLRQGAAVKQDETLQAYIARSDGEAMTVSGGDKPPLTEAELLEKAVELALEHGQMSITVLRRKLEIGHPRAALLMEKMIETGVLENTDGPYAKKTIITKEEYAQMKSRLTGE